ncbi:Pentatricopeptide repeat-containing protein [Zostera marina]|uniref:Pentatricopeptide repeat-containing protein n=1 Tax=Zostera marina TaxID=29655 RepID=A0A0K9PW94_ZOSMR|nr:Pentatricopeptide repeat-containing protein [Zostera marina]
MAIAHYASSCHLHYFLRHLRPFSTTIIAEFGKPQPKLFAIDSEVKHLVKDRKFTEIETLLEEKMKDATNINQESYFATIIVSYAYANMLNRAHAIFDNMPNLGFTASRTSLSLNALLTSYAHDGQHSRVPDLLADLSKKHFIAPNSISYGILINSLCKLGSPEKACETLEEMEEKKMKVSPFTYTPIIDAFYKMKKKEEAEKMWVKMVGSGCMPDHAVFNVKATYISNYGKPGEMLELMEEMEKTGIKPDIVTFNLLISCYCKNGKLLDAKNLYSNLKEKNVRPNAATYRNFSRLLCKNKDFDMGFKVCKEGIMKKKYPDFVPAKILVEGLVKNEKKEEAEWICGVLKKKFPPRFIDSWKKMMEKLELNVVNDEGMRQSEGVIV